MDPLAGIERWFRSLKTELIYINEFHSPKHRRMSIRDYIETYNSVRPHEALDYETPDGSLQGLLFKQCAGVKQRLDSIQTAACQG